MQHYIMINHYTGYVWEEADASDPIEVCRLIDQKISPGIEREYERVGRLDCDGYHVYLAGADWVPVHNGQSSTEIARVEALPKVAEVRFKTLQH